MRLIDADALDEVLEVGPDCYHCKIGRENCEQDARLSIIEICGIIAEQKTVDAVEVVRCKDCVYFRGDHKPCYYGIQVSVEDYCSFGERVEWNEID